MGTLLRALAVCLAVWGTSGLAQDADAYYDIETAEINGEVIRYVRDELLVKPTLGTDVSKLATDLDATVLDSIPDIRWYRLRLLGDQDALPSWEQTQDDARVEASSPHVIHPLPGENEEGPGPDRLDCPPPPAEEVQWPITTCGADQAWAQVPQSDVIIAILDTGVDQAHVMAVEFQVCSRIEVGRDWYHHKGGEFGPAWDEDTSAHGTHRVGEIGAPWDGEGIAGIIAGSYDVDGLKCRVLVEKVAASSGLWSAWAVVQALTYVVGERGARVVSLSLYNIRPTSPHYDLYYDAFYTVNTQRRNTVILCCSGNTGLLDQPYGPYVPWMTYPAAWSTVFECVIAVGASFQDDHIDSTTEWRSGPWSGELSIVAPAEMNSYCATQRYGDYSSDSIGQTSSATAFAAGLAGMIVAKYPRLLNYQIRDKLQNGAWRIDLPVGYDWDWFSLDHWGRNCWSERVGSGRIDAVYSLASTCTPRCPYPKPGQCNRPSVELTQSADGQAHVEVYDLLGRTLWCGAFLGQSFEAREVGSFVNTLEGLPRGPKVIRVRTPTEVRTWRLAP